MKVSDIKPVKYELVNGVKVNIIPDPSLNTANVSVRMAFGSWSDPKGKAGIAHFIEHMLHKSCDKFSETVLNRELGKRGIYRNAFTSEDTVVYHESGVAKELPFMVRSLAESIKAPKFKEDEVESERHVVLDEFSYREQNRASLVYDNLMFNVFRDKDTVAAMPIIGKREEVSTITREDLIDYHAERYIGPNMTVIVIGNVDVDKTIDLVSRNFGDIDRGCKAVSRTSAKVRPLFRPLKDVRPSDDTCQVIMGWALDGVEKKSLKELFIDDVVENMMFNGPMSKLYETVRTKHGLCYQIYGFFRVWKKKGLCYIAGSTAYENLDKFVALVQQELKAIDSIEKVVKNGFENAKTCTLNRFLMECDDLSETVMNVWYMLRLGKPIDFAAIRDAIESVSARDVLRRIREIALRDPVVCTVVNKE